MIKRNTAICWWCKHFSLEKKIVNEPFSCSAFPEGIPEEIIDGEFDHRNHYPSDNQITFEKLTDFDEIKKRIIHKNVKTMDDFNLTLGLNIGYLELATSKQSED